MKPSPIWHVGWSRCMERANTSKRVLIWLAEQGGVGVYLSNRPHLLWVYWRDNPRGMLGEHSKSLYITSRGEWCTCFSSVLPTSQVGYHACKPTENVVYCFYKITLSKLWVYQPNKPWVFNQSERAYYLSSFINYCENGTMQSL